MDTVTRGMDLVINYRRQFELGGALTGTFAGNYNTTDFDRIAGTPAPIAALGITTPLFDLTQQLRYSDSQPRDKLMLNLNYTCLLYTSPSPRDQRGSRMPSSA